MRPPFQILCIGRAEPDLSTSAFGPFTVSMCDRLEQAALMLRTQRVDAILINLGPEVEAEVVLRWSALSHAVLEAAVVVVAPEPPPGVAVRLLQAGVQDVLAQREANGALLARALRLGLERKAIDRSARKAYATDLATGLPNHSQLLEHMTHLLALREREPAPMALLVLRVEGLATVEATLGPEAANVLRRKVAVRLRAGLRASDVVASVGADSFAVLLAWIDAPGDGERVMRKLAQALRQPFSVAGRDLAVAVSAGLGLYPEHGKEADALMRRALGQAANMSAEGRAGFVNRVERGPAQAANDEGPVEGRPSPL
jgi:diguanylate cyclase (GGDEF)-like protein